MARLQPYYGAPEYKIARMQPLTRPRLQFVFAGIAMSLYAGVLVLSLCAVYDLASREAKAHQQPIPEAACPNVPAPPPGSARASVLAI